MPAVNAQVNVTVDDTDPSIQYQPSTSWHASGASCSTCLQPDSGIMYNHTWHDGTHIIPTSDDDDFTTSSSMTRTSTAATPSSSGKKDSDGDNGDSDGDSDKGKRSRLGFRRRDIDGSNPFTVSKLDSDDPGFKDTPVTMKMNFTGTGIYVYCTMPLGPAPANATPTFMNLTYTLDGHSSGMFVHNGMASASGFIPKMNVLARSNLTDAPHSLTVYVGPDSVFLFDYAIYTQSHAVQPNATQTSSAGITQSTGSSNAVESSSSAHNVATFGGAVGGSFGVLTVLGLGLAFSIYRRRRISSRRERLRRQEEAEQNTLHTNDSEDGPPMQGPAPFVPRYFPGTVPTAPPPYVPRSAPLLSALQTDPVPASIEPPPGASSGVRLSTSSDSMSYADRPPPLDDAIAPPPFGVAVASPIPALLTEVLEPPGLPRTRGRADSVTSPSASLLGNVYTTGGSLSSPDETVEGVDDTSSQREGSRARDTDV
ncbi:hypothetical protein PLICRDRAFT_40423 [Plicaturopsis crispa FD-325 SS-3]|nr:hypothetical protein PLICRDRAFT_40423 [Plicaturopsis crispa FD-325 SS-3]